MPGKSPYPAELRRRAVRMVAEVRPDYPTEWATINAVATKLGIGTAETRGAVLVESPIRLSRVLDAEGRGSDFP